jgi:pimeloyl-ACP methyl ester carboxylesterase
MERRAPRRYDTLEEATQRMREANPHLTPEMARHLTLHGARENEDGTLSWKFDNYVRIMSPYEFNMDDARDIWAQVMAPTLLIKGAESWALDPGHSRLDAIRNREAVIIPEAGHWVHHDRLEEFMRVVHDFLAPKGSPLLSQDGGA